MPETIRALIVILFFAAGVFWLAKRAFAGHLVADSDFARRRNLWLAITITAFLANNIWLYVVVTGVLLHVGMRRELNPLGLYFFLVFVLPTVAGTIPGFGIVDKLFSVDIIRLLGLLVLLPAMLALRRRPDAIPFGRLLPDKLLLGYLVINFVVSLGGTTTTDAIRQYLLYPFLEIFLPYYVASRQLRSVADFKDALASFVVATLLLAIIGVFESMKGWLLYHSLSTSLRGADFWGWGYLARGASLRAVATVAQPIPLGYVMAVALALLLFVRPWVPNPRHWKIMFVLICAGSIAAMSRGPWIGTVAMLVVFLATGATPVRSLFRFFAGATSLLGLALLSPMGPRIMAVLPFVGTVDTQNVDYRTMFIDRALVVIGRNPLFGAVDYHGAPEFDDLKWQGVLDTLNVFLEVALRCGLVGLLLFGGIFVVVGRGLFRSMRAQRGRDEELHLLGRALLAALTAVIVIINTMSSVSVIQLVFWCLLGVCVAYINLARQPLQPQARRTARAR